MTTILTARIESNYLLIQGSGIIADLKDEKRWADACYKEILRQNSQRVLIDQRKIAFKTSIIDKIDVVPSYLEDFNYKIRTFCIAFLVNPAEIELHQFFELYANNRGYHWKVFMEKHAADAFLNADE